MTFRAGQQQLGHASDGEIRIVNLMGDAGSQGAYRGESARLQQLGLSFLQLLQLEPDLLVQQRLLNRGGG